MKKHIFILFLSLITVPAIHAQLIRFGVKGGGNFASQSIKYNGKDLNSSGYDGFHAGVLSAIKIPIIGIGVQAEALYSQKGSDFTVDGAKVKNRFDYIDVPIYVRWSLGLPLISPYIGVGPYFSFPINTKVKSTNNAIQWANSSFNNSDFGFGATFGAEILNKLQVSVSYQLGTKNLYNGNNDINVKNRNVAVSVGLLIF